MMSNCTPSKLDSELQRDLQKYIWSGVQLVGGLGEEHYEIGYYIPPAMMTTRYALSFGKQNTDTISALG